MRIELRQFGTFKRDRRALAEWAASLASDKVVLESTGIYWKSPYAALEAAGICAQVVNARHQECPRSQDRRRRCAMACYLGTCRAFACFVRAIDGGIRLGVVVSDLHGQSARTVVKAIVAGWPTHQVLKLASRRLKASREELFGACSASSPMPPAVPSRSPV